MLIGRGDALSRHDAHLFSKEKVMMVNNRVANIPLCLTNLVCFISNDEDKRFISILSFKKIVTDS